MYRSSCRLCVAALRTSADASRQVEVRRLLNAWRREDLLRNVEVLQRDQALNDRNKVHAAYRLVSTSGEDSLALAGKILDEVVVEVECGRFTHPQSVARLCYCWAKARPSTPLPECLSAALCDDQKGDRCRRIGRLNSGTLAGLLWAYAKTAQTPGHDEVFSVAAQHLSNNLASLDDVALRGAGILLWSFATYWKHRRAEPLPSDLLLALAERVLSDPTAQPGEVSGALWAVATLELWREDSGRAVLPIVRRAVGSMLRSWPRGFSVQEFSKTLWAVTRTETLSNSEEVREVIERACDFVLGQEGSCAFNVKELAMVATALSSYVLKAEKEDRHATDALVAVLNSISAAGSIDGNLATFAQAMLPVEDRVGAAAKDKLLVAAEEALVASKLDTASLLSVVDLFGEACPSVALTTAWTEALKENLRQMREGAPVEIRSVGYFGTREICAELGILGPSSEVPEHLEAKLLGRRFAAVAEYSLMPEDGDGESLVGPPTVYLPVPQGISSASVLTPYRHGWVRNTEPDFQALESVARVLEAHKDVYDCGWVRLVISRAPCVSSLAAMAQFVSRYPDVDLQVWFHGPRGRRK